MQFPWQKNRNRRELLAQPFPIEWQGYLSAVAYYALLPNSQQAALQDITRVLIAEKHWEGCGGLVLTDEMQVVIAAQAAVLVLGFDADYYPNVETILVYPSGFLVTTTRPETGRVLREDLVPLSGEAAQRGPVVISWLDALQGGRNLGDGRNVVLHEFAHKLDMRDGAADGAPYLKDGAQVDRWSSVMSAEYAVLVQRTLAGEPTLLDAYGTTNAAEFFAVSTECFFERPRPMHHFHPELYGVLRDYYRQDPAELFAAHGKN